VTKTLNTKQLSLLRRATSKQSDPAVTKAAGDIATQAKAKGAFVSAAEFAPLDMGDGAIIFENGSKVTGYEEVSVPELADRMPIHFDVETTPLADNVQHLDIGRGPGSVDYGWLGSGELYLYWTDRGSATMFTWKSKDREVWDANSNTNRDLWGYSKKVVVEPRDTSWWSGDNIVQSIYVSAWPTSGSKSRIKGWHDYEPFASSGSCDTFLDVSIGPIAVPLNDCEGYERWIRYRNGSDYGYGAMGVTHDQGFWISGGDRQAGLAMAVKVETDQTPYWNDRLTITMVLSGQDGDTATCTTYRYNDQVYCWD